MGRRSGEPENIRQGQPEVDADPEVLRRRIIGLVGPLVTDHHASLVDVEVTGRINSRLVRLLVHKKPSITLDLCEAIAREAGDLLDVEDPIPGRYRLEVTSPGLDRPLVTDADFVRAKGRRLKIILVSGRTACGQLTECTGETIGLWADAQEVDIDRADIAKATIEVEYDL